MFNLQGGEIVIILLLALVVLGPEKLPDAMRKAGKAYAELKKMSTGFQEEFRSVIDEPLREVRDTANVLRDSADFTKLQTGERTEKPKSAEMAPADPDTRPTDEVPTFDDEDEDGPPEPLPAPRRPGDVDITEEAAAGGDGPAVEGEAPDFVVPPKTPRPFSSSHELSSTPALRESAPVDGGAPSDPPDQESTG